MRHGVFDAAQADRIDDFARSSHNKDVAHFLVEDHLGSDARIRAADDDRERLLALRDFPAAIGYRCGSRPGKLARDKAGVAPLQPPERFLCRNARRFMGEGIAEPGLQAEQGGK